MSGDWIILEGLEASTSFIRVNSSVSICVTAQKQYGKRANKLAKNDCKSKRKD